MPTSRSAEAGSNGRGHVMRSPDETSSGDKRNRLILASAGTSIIQRGAQFASTLIVMPVLLHVLGPAQFGIWGAAASLAWLSSLADIGTGSALVTLIARASGSRDWSAARRHLGGALTLGLGLAFVFICSGFAAYKFGILTPAPLPTFIAIAGVAANVPLSVANNVWIALQKGYIGASWELVQTIVLTAGLLWVSLFSANVSVFVGALYAALILANLGSLAHLLIGRAH